MLRGQEEVQFEREQISIGVMVQVESDPELCRPGA